MLRTVTATGLFALLLLSGSTWLILNQFLPSGRFTSYAIVGVGVVFVGIFLWLIVTRIRDLLSSAENLLRKIALLGVDLVLLLLAFAWAYQMQGIIDTTQPIPVETSDFISCVYYSVVTFTTLGYGDFQPQGAGRALAALEALTGYIILGLLASTGASILSPHEQPRLHPEEE